MPYVVSPGGQQGFQGNQGAQGAQGAQGTAGAQGSQGAGPAPGTDPFSIMAAAAKAWGAALTTPVVFGSAYLEDFALGSLTVDTAVGGVGAVTYSTNATNYGSAGIIDCSVGNANGDFSIAVPKNNNAWVADLINSTYYISFKATLLHAMTQTNSIEGVGILNAVAVAGSAKFCVFGLIQTQAFGSGAITTLGFTTYNGTTQAYHTGGTVADVGNEHYYALAHDAIAHMFYGYVDGVLVDSISDATFAASLGGTAFAIYAQATTGGGIKCDKVYSVI